MDTTACNVKKIKVLAERVGFEPTLEFPLNTLSKRAPSATRPSLRTLVWEALHGFRSASASFDSIGRARVPQPHSPRWYSILIFTRAHLSLLANYGGLK